MKRLSALVIALALAAPGFSQQTPQRDLSVRPQLTAETRSADLKAFRDLFFARDKSYSPEARAEAEKRLAALEGRAAGMSEPAFELELARIVALSDNGHTHYVLSSISRYYNAAPIRLLNIGEDFYVARTVSANADLLGAKLTAIDGHGLAELRAATRPLWGGVTAYRDKYAYTMLESPELLNTLGLAAKADAATYRFETRAGKTVERKLVGEASSATRPFASPYQVALPGKLPNEGVEWVTALAADKAPWSLQEQGKTFRWRRAPEVKGIVIELRRNTDVGDEKIMPALDVFKAAIEAEKPTNIVLDMRLNGGGDLNRTRAFIQSLPKLTPGRVFVLTSPLTFSAAISSVGYLKQAGGEKVTIVGEPVGDRMMFWAEGGGIDLPNNFGRIGLATERHDYQGGCKAWKDCHRSVVFAPIAVPTLAPDIAAPWTIDAWLAGRDPAMEAVEKALK